MSYVMVGTKIPAQDLPHLNRYPLALSAGHRPNDLDSPAGEAEAENAFAHGALSIAYLAGMLSNWQPRARVLKFDTRSGAIASLYEAQSCSGEVIELQSEGDETIARCAIQAVRSSGKKTRIGEALVSL
jgi:hypothetical protein